VLGAPGGTLRIVSKICAMTVDCLELGRSLELLQLPMYLKAATASDPDDNKTKEIIHLDQATFPHLARFCRSL